MKKHIALFVSFIFIFSLLPVIPSFAAEWEVAPGVDTLAQAVASATSGDTLLLGNGTYYITSTLNVNKTLTIKAKTGTSPIITGSTPLTAWQAVGDGIYRTPFSGTALPMLTEDGAMATIARWPNKPSALNFTNGYIFATNGYAGTLNFSRTLPQGVTATGLQLIGWGSADTNWTNTILPVTSISQGVLTYSGTMVYGVSAGTRFYIRGHKALIDSPGEYALDNGYLYYFPYNSDNLDKVASASGFGTVIHLSAPSSRLEGLSIKGTPYTTKSSTSTGNAGDNVAVLLSSTGGTINNCVFDAIGSHAIYIGGTGNTVSNSVITNTGVSGVYLAGNSNRVYNNSVSKTGLEYSGGAAISINSAYNTIDHNEIFDNPRWGINITFGSLPGNIIEYNELYNCNTDSSDTGLIYTFLTTANAQNPTIIRYNHLHDSYIYGGMGFGIYLDDDTTYAKVYGNLINGLGNRNVGSLSAPIMIKGSYHEVYNNIIANNDNLATTEEQWNNSSIIMLQQLRADYTTKDNRVYKNVIYENENNTMWRVMNASSDVNYKTVMSYCDQNVYYANIRGGANSYANTKYYVNSGGCWCDVRENPWNTVFDQNSYFDTDPGFVDGLNNDFRLTSNSILHSIGFEELPQDRMGRISSPDISTSIPTPSFENIVWIGNTFTANFVGEGLEKNRSMTLCAVSYNANNQICGLNFTPVTTDGLGNLTRNIVVATDGNRHIKVFLWDLTSITPLTPFAEYQE